ncbi:uncharacterized protein LOC115774831 [Archocentrus centrarchus]|uniref:uncharacterized protein LOC115774831 n=1 Tax=Archocentrus centrarchus TaxID=63155 RepID=UPI0011E9C852|nr:uncharacterized protein LOC115774831 [Archocentrus centrarchus]
MIAVLVFLMLELQFTGTQGAVSFWPLAVRDGDEVTLPCSNKCNRTTWSFTGSIVLFQHEQKKATSDRVSLNANCSLVIHKVTAEDAGHYACREDSTDRYPGHVLEITLSVAVMTEEKYGDSVMLHCSVSTPVNCDQVTVTWFHRSIDIFKDPFIETSQFGCSAIVTILNFTYSNISSYDFMCYVVTYQGRGELFTFSPHLSDEKTNTSSENNTNTVSEQQNGGSVTLSSSVSPPDECEQEKMKWIHKSTAWWRFIIVAVVLAALITVVVIVTIWTKDREKTQRDENMVFNEEDGGAVKNESVQSTDEV